MPTKIEWARNPDGTAGESWNPIRARRKSDGKVGWFCTKVSTGCAHCYSERRNNRFGTALPYTAASLDEIEVFLDEKVLEKPLHWRKPRTVFVMSMGDLFHEDVPDEFILRVFDIIAMTPQHTYQILTKRPVSLLDWYEKMTQNGYLAVQKPDGRICDNVWLGTSVENQAAADERREYLRQCPAAVKFVSYEPAIAAVDWDGWEFVDQIIGGGESGTGARPSHPDWHRGTRDWCHSQRPKIKYFFKQWGAWAPYPNDGQFGPPGNQFHWFGEQEGPPDMWRVGKKTAGRLLDGCTWSEMPGQEEKGE